MLQFFKRIAQRYDQHLQSSPLITKAITSGIVVGASDVCVQLATEDHYDIRRTLFVGGGYGACWFAPVLHGVTTTWARILPATTFSALSFKTIVDMTTVFPINVSVMLGMNAVARQPDASAMDVVDSIQDNFWPSYSKGWLLWRKFPDTAHPYIGIVVLLYTRTCMCGTSMYNLPQYD